jgi:hypothetical protein
MKRPHADSEACDMDKVQHRQHEQHRQTDRQAMGQGDNDVFMLTI